MSEQTDCEWFQDGDSDAWETKCRNYFVINEGTPEENCMKFCCYCGRPLKEVLYTEGAEEA